MFKCLLSKNEGDIQTFLEGYDPLRGEWKSVNGEIKYKKDCEKCTNITKLKEK